MILRKEVYHFSHGMEYKLRANDHKGGWDRESLKWLLDRLYDEASELSDEIHFTNKDLNKIEDECLDVANFAMMIFSKARSQRLEESH